ncbi:hypothetical protein GE09DRAFT_1096185 [Coniochaeta sp. 2T2.1]|nr:hypothetical protein GE09DRAFT_1096185 [Coniochaeta sp. 2T2.1]
MPLFVLLARSSHRRPRHQFEVHLEMRANPEGAVRRPERPKNLHDHVARPIVGVACHQSHVNGQYLPPPVYTPLSPSLHTLPKHGQYSRAGLQRGFVIPVNHRESTGDSAEDFTIAYQPVPLSTRPNSELMVRQRSTEVALPTSDLRSYNDYTSEGMLTDQDLQRRRWESVLCVNTFESLARSLACQDTFATAQPRCCRLGWLCSPRQSHLPLYLVQTKCEPPMPSVRKSPDFRLYPQTSNCSLRQQAGVTYGSLYERFTSPASLTGLVIS